MLTPANEEKVDMLDIDQGERKLYLEEQVETCSTILDYLTTSCQPVLTFQEHPEEGGQVEISQDYLADTPYLDYHLVVIRVDHVLEHSQD